MINQGKYIISGFHLYSRYVLNYDCNELFTIQNKDDV